MSFSDYLNRFNIDAETKALADRRETAKQLTAQLGIPPPAEGYSNMNVQPQDIETLYAMLNDKNKKEAAAANAANAAASTASTVDNEDSVSDNEFKTFIDHTTKQLMEEGWSMSMIPKLLRTMWDTHQATAVDKKKTPSVKESPKTGKRKRDDDPPSYAECKPPEKWPGDLLKSIMEAAGLKKGKNREEMAESLKDLIFHFNKQQ